MRRRRERRCFVFGENNMKRKLLDAERARARADEYMGVGLVPQNVNLSPLKLFFSLPEKHAELPATRRFVLLPRGCQVFGHYPCMLVSLVHGAVQKLILSTQQKRCIIVQCGRRFKCAFWTFNILVFCFFVGPNSANPSIPRTPRTNVDIFPAAGNALE